MAHEDSGALRRMAVFDVLVNNADRKGAHILAMPGGHRYGVDHGLTFHVQDKLRTVLWGWLGEKLTEEKRDGVGRVLEGLSGDLGDKLAGLLLPDDIAALGARCTRLLEDQRFPAPSGRTPAVPWPLF
ncbi:putative repeat protein (TIGR03843 family) [Micrococcus aloeverae]|uniref:Repeat protein (TIGR03843 family) n=1 Tax=Micrococcus aloeverae TaxID=1391911 RepID=A0ABR6DVC0_9MICC|nr:putative repeat protein (TIGR03843 family) [Micrococcus aloeverae]